MIGHRRRGHRRRTPSAGIQVTPASEPASARAPRSARRDRSPAHDRGGHGAPATPPCPPQRRGQAGGVRHVSASGSGWSGGTATVRRTYLVSGSLTDNLGPGTYDGLLALALGRRDRRLRGDAVLRPVHPRRQAPRSASTASRPRTACRCRRSRSSARRSPTAASGRRCPTPSACGTSRRRAPTVVVIA